MIDENVDLRAILASLDPSARDTLRGVLIHGFQRRGSRSPYTRPRRAAVADLRGYRGCPARLGDEHARAMALLLGFSPGYHLREYLSPPYPDPLRARSDACCRALPDRG